MKKKLLLTFVFLMAVSCYVNARTVYDSTGRYILVDDTIRGRARANQERVLQRKQAAAAAKLNYEEVQKTNEKGTKDTSNTKK